MERAVTRRLIAFHKRLAQDVWTISGGELTTQRVDLDDLDTRRRYKIGNGRAGCRSLDKFGPDRQGRLGAGEIELTLIIEADPNDGQ